MVQAIAPKPLNVLMMGPGLSAAELADLGVRRISVGGALARVIWAALLSAAQQLKAGSFDGLAGGIPGQAPERNLRWLRLDRREIRRVLA